MDIKPINLSRVVQEMAHLLEASISKKIALKTDFLDPIPLMDGDAAQIRQVIMNLITNASDAIGDKKGIISIKTGIIDCPKSYLASCYLNNNLPPGPYVFVEVSDTGCGMTAETMERMFDPFFTTKVRGRGLGLAAVLTIVRSHKGTLKVYSTPGHGTTFRVLFPCSTFSPEEEKTAPAEHEPWKGSGTVLVVDDDEIIRNLSEQLLKCLGFDPISANNAPTALEAVRNQCGKLSAILLDVTLPEVSGKEILDQIRKFDSNTPVILMSGYNEQMAVGDMKPGLYQAFLQKPFTAEALSRAMRDAIEPIRPRA